MKTYTYIVSAAFIFLASFSAPSLQTFADPVAVGESQAFVVSAYYSPLPNQKTYVWGSYEADIRMNGQGLRGADFTKVYPGMLAAPQSYPFGTKIYIPGVGTATVHDRGGAIQEWGNADRIDVWMGWGDDGRVRALQWGMRELTGTIMAPGTPDNPEFSVLPASAQVDYSQVVTATFPTSAGESSTTFYLAEGDRGSEVTELQEFLHEKGYLAVEPTGYFGSQTKAAVFAFQKSESLVSAWSDRGAGIYGPLTQAALAKASVTEAVVASVDVVESTAPVAAETIETAEVAETAEVKNVSSPYTPDYAVIQPNMQVGDTGESVKRLQLVLQGLGYYNAHITGKYDATTADAVYAYQVANVIVSSRTQAGAGRFGPQTYSHLVNALLAKRARVQSPVSSDTDHLSASQIAMRRQKINLAQYDVEYGEKSEEVVALQEELIARGFLDEGLNTGFYGQKTQAAIGAYRAYVG